MQEMPQVKVPLITRQEIVKANLKVGKPVEIYHKPIDKTLVRHSGFFTKVTLSGSSNLQLKLK